MWLALALVILAACFLAAGSWRVYSNTWDEPEHLAAGVQLLDRGLYQYDTEHPPLGRVFLALGPYLAGARSFGTPPPEGTQEGLDILYCCGHYNLYLTLARLGALPFLGLLLWSTWLWARRLFVAPAAALVAVVLLASVPAVLGNGALASLDVAAAATILLALYALQRWIVSARLADAVLFGLASGVALSTKFSSVPFVGLGLLTLALAHAATRWHPGAPAEPGTSAARRLSGLLLAGVVALAAVFLVYAPRASDPGGIAARFNWAVSYLTARPGMDHQLGVLLGHLMLPRELKDLVNGVVAVKAHNDTGHLSYLLGQLSMTGWWYFYLVALAVKTPIPLLVAGSCGIFWLAYAGWRARDSWALAPAVLVITLLTFASTFSRINIGIRHVLIVYPFLALGATYVLVRSWRALSAASQPRLMLAGTALLAAALTWQLSTLWRAYPDYLPYFNEAVADPQHVLVDSDLDWGQDLRRLEWRAAQLKIPELHLAYRGTADLTREALPPLTILPPRQPASGWVAVSALARTRNPADYAWLNPYRPLERIGKTIDLYYIP
jgi:4-amino-4-deoxy-L-arabinose transferase-like glycosyltransferase